MKIYLIQCGYHSCDNSEPIVGTIYTTFEGALKHIDDAHTIRELQQIRNRKTNELLNSWSDGDYYVSIVEGYLDSPSLYMSKEEYEAL